MRGTSVHHRGLKSASLSHGAGIRTKFVTSDRVPTIQFRQNHQRRYDDDAKIVLLALHIFRPTANSERAAGLVERSPATGPAVTTREWRRQHLPVRVRLTKVGLLVAPGCGSRILQPLGESRCRFAAGAAKRNR